MQTLQRLQMSKHYKCIDRIVRNRKKTVFTTINVFRFICFALYSEKKDGKTAGA